MTTQEQPAPVPASKPGIQLDDADSLAEESRVDAEVDAEHIYADLGDLDPENLKDALAEADKREQSKRDLLKSRLPQAKNFEGKRVKGENPTLSGPVKLAGTEYNMEIQFLPKKFGKPREFSVSYLEGVDKDGGRLPAKDHATVKVSDVLKSINKNNNKFVQAADDAKYGLRQMMTKLQQDKPDEFQNLCDDFQNKLGRTFGANILTGLGVTPLDQKIQRAPSMGDEPLYETIPPEVSPRQSMTESTYAEIASVSLNAPSPNPPSPNPPSTKDHTYAEISPFPSNISNTEKEDQNPNNSGRDADPAVTQKGGIIHELMKVVEEFEKGAHENSGFMNATEIEGLGSAILNGRRKDSAENNSKLVKQHSAQQLEKMQRTSEKNGRKTAKGVKKSEKKSEKREAKKQKKEQLENKKIKKKLKR